MASTFPLMKLPSELRLEIYKYALRKHQSIIPSIQRQVSHHPDSSENTTALLRVNKIVYHEARFLFYTNNHFHLVIPLLQRRDIKNSILITSSRTVSNFPVPSVYIPFLQRLSLLFPLYGDFSSSDAYVPFIFIPESVEVISDLQIIRHLAYHNANLSFLSITVQSTMTNWVEPWVSRPRVAIQELSRSRSKRKTLTELKGLRTFHLWYELYCNRASRAEVWDGPSEEDLEMRGEETDFMWGSADDSTVAEVRSQGWDQVKKVYYGYKRGNGPGGGHFAANGVGLWFG